MIIGVEHGAEIGVREHRALGIAGGAAGILQHRHLVRERAVRIANIGAVIGDERGEIELRARPGDSARRRTEGGARHRDRQKILDRADHQGSSRAVPLSAAICG